MKITGKLPSGKLKEKIQRSPNYKIGSFQNLSPISFKVQAFPGANEYKAEHMPAIDYLILTHDH